ncbi:MAG: PEP-CTERM sorting domain-containing protein [Kiritimatiellae bacterium]|nr:PEP-CTERM sorting domain-containing protein [Kiritimatiellia bacterium]
MMKNTMMKKFLTLVILLAVIPATSFALVISTADGDGADATVRRGIGNNFGANPELYLRDAASSSDRKAYMRFDLSDVTFTIDDATLDLIWNRVDSGTATINFYGLNDGYAGDVGILGEDWLEGIGNNGFDGTNTVADDINWDNAPGNNVGSSQGFNAAATTSLGSINVDFSTISVGDTLSLTSSNLSGLVAFLNADTNNLATIMMSAGFANGAGFSTKEDPTYAAPTLTVIPEPSSLALMLCFVVAGFAFLRRSR